MKPAPSFLVCWLLVLALSALTACSPAVTETRFSPLPVSNRYATLHFDDKNNVKIEYTTVEPEEVLKEELSALKKVGDWDDGHQQKETADSRKVTSDFPITINKQVEFYLDLFQNRQRSYIKRWLARSTKYLPMIREELRKAGLPQDLAYLAMIESGFNPSAYSHAHAAGLWQFIRSTGRNYNLRIDSWVDERRAPEKATKSAVAYLSNLYNQFGFWYLAVAAYNAGEGKINRAIKKYKTKDFWKLARKPYLNLETKRYVPKLIAAILIAKDPQKYGLTDINYQSPLQYDTIKVPPRTNIGAVAMACDISTAKLRKLNSELLTNLTPPGRKDYALKIPAGTHDLVAQNLSRVYPIAAIGYKTHIVRRGDTLTRICRRYRLNKTILLKANNLRTARLHAGQHLRIPYRSTRYIMLKKGESPENFFARSAGGEGPILHQIKPGETLSGIARRYRVSVEIIMRWNNLQSAGRIRAGQQLALYLFRPGQNQAAVAALAPQHPGTPTLADVNKKKTTRTADETALVYYRVQRGDTLWDIAQKFRISTGNIREWNNLTSNMIHPGRRLVVGKG
ncbi:Membrane-bound lytic murein transglycosylase D [hydrothermal vent metagenome]|uniref:Membrane-bound lytic murein transglycosylase D n=1 Tax=hydrothermal vent metagenome TaxID=652676 RepID=A0A3B0UZ42_9ZZZZ